MNKLIANLKPITLATILIEGGLLFFFGFFLKVDYEFLATIFWLANIVLVIGIFYVHSLEKKQREIDISRVLGNEAKEALDYGQVGIIIYDENYIVTWVSEFLTDRGFNIIGEKIAKSIPGLKGIFTENADNLEIVIDDVRYQFTKSDDQPVIYVKDITEFSKMRDNYEYQMIVLGLISLDNYDETVQREDEQRIALINTNIRQKVVEWAVKHEAVIRRLRSDRFLVILNKKHFTDMAATRFEILNTIKKESEKLSVAITASMSFAYGGNDLVELDSSINNLLELVLARGGDQVAVKEKDHDVEFYGTSSEQSEKGTKIKARVMAQSLKGLIDKCSNVIVVPHKEADLDAFGGALGISKIVSGLGKECYILMDGIKVEPKTKEIYDNNYVELMRDHSFIDPFRALEIIDEDTLLIVNDHHSADMTSNEDVVGAVKTIAVIDHHRRKSETNIPATMIYNEPTASSTVEIISELLQYQKKEIELTELEATIMYSGLLVDTDELKARTSSRTFEACAYLRKAGCDVTMANEWLKESLGDMINKSEIVKAMEIIGDNMAVAAVDDPSKILGRTAIAQGANYICSVKEIDAAFVVAWTDADTVSISARSNGTVNVQIIVEQLGGGGHYNAAGLQRTGTTVATVKKELLAAINEYLEKR